MATINPDIASLAQRLPAHFACANHGGKNVKGKGPCPNKAKVACECKDAHASAHIKDCQSEMLKSTWEPRWSKENRSPAFMGDGKQSISIFGATKYLWGNVPAVDLIKLKDNEGVGFKQDIDLLFAASGDLRNVILSIGQLPDQYTQTVTTVLNDKEFDVVARNTIMLLILATVEDKAEAADCVLHIFYSAFLTKSHMEVLTNKIGPLVQEVCDKTSAKPADAILAKTWVFGGSENPVQIRVVLSRGQWLGLLAMLKAPKKVKQARARDIRDRVVNARERIDYVDRHLLCQLPNIRMGSHRFRVDGILLPFGASRADFVLPNPTFFYKKDIWPMLDSADPFAGWPLPTVLDCCKGPAKEDAYGALYEYVLDCTGACHDQMTKRKTSFELYCTDARLLDGLIGNKKFDRIDLSNICDRGFVGIENTLKVVGPMLKDTAANDKATILGLFMNAVPEMERLHDDDLEDRAEASGHMRKVIGYMDMPFNTTMSSAMSKQSINTMALLTIKISSAIQTACDMDGAFAAYMEICQFDNVTLMGGFEIKEKNTLVDKWPMRFHFGGVTTRAKRDFARLLSSHHIGIERYVEWKMAKKPVVDEVL
ncbi:uncharacterized protein PpBr36_09426 [Pyricularia pennisetigena]|uniref:uncharacterized protein n=1 Tax=Pyricularia pennisetigena TaxID=1578925 RepID=UPI00114FC163|nr:uncharacterized protein PpBr36_09426 [Pyricularia pennisetigena]TLS21936.1 hypothetical protein PpBr36_09426 [Pyricularia pennisetigena]